MTSRPIDALSERFVEEYAALDPLTATVVGISGHDDALTDYSPDGFAAREEATRAALAAATGTTPVDEREQVAREALCERLGLDVERAEAGLDRCDLNVLSSPLHAIRQVFDLMPRDGEQAWADIDARLAAIPATLAGYRITLAEEAAQGHVVAVRQYAEVAEQVRNWTGQVGRSGDLFAALVAESEVDGPLRAQLDTHAAAASRAVADFGLFLSDEMEPRGRAQDAVGADAYALASRVFLGAEIDLEETYAWAWDELARLDDEVARTCAEILPGAGLDETLAHLDADPARRIEGKEAFRDWMQQLAERAVDDLAGVHFDIPEPIRRIECCLAPTNDGGIYYTGPSEDFSRPGRMWWAVPDDQTWFSPWRETTTVFHEGVPGHHLQIGQMTWRKELLNRWQRTLCWVSGHGEGWALYAERLMEELGHLEDPADRLGMLDGQTLRAARVIVDIGLHLGLRIPDNHAGFHPGERWTPELVLEFMRANSRMDDAIIRFEVKRYLGWAGQAPSYKVGERIWLQAREDARARHGADFDLKAFHAAALDLGSLGLAPLQAALARI